LTSLICDTTYQFSLRTAPILLRLFRVTTCLENLEMSGNLTAVREMSGILLKFGEMLWKSCLKLCIVSCIFASIQVFSTSMGMIRVTLNMPSAANRQGISHCLESGHPDYFTFVTSRCSVHCSVAYLGVGDDGMTPFGLTLNCCTVF